MRWVALGVFASIALSINICIAQPLRVVAVSGQQAPGTPAGVNFSSFQDLSLADSSKVLFSAFLSPAAPSGYWIYQDGSLQTLARVGDPLPSGIVSSPSAVWTGMLDAAINRNGQVAIQGTTSTSTAVTSFLVTGTPGALSPVVISGDVAPGTGGKLFQSFPQQSLSIGNDGKVAFYASLRPTGPLPTVTNTGLWMGKPGDVTLVARGGDPAPGAGAGITFSEMKPVLYPDLSGFFYPPMLSGGKIGFFAQTSSSGGPLGEGIWAGAPGALSKIARTTEPGGQFSRLNINNFFFGQGMDSSGNVAFLATRSDNLPGIWLAKDSTIQTIALKGTDPTFSVFSQPDVNSSGRILFWSGNGSRQALWSWYDGQLQKIASGTDLGFSELGGTFPTDHYAINDKGQVAFVAFDRATTGAFGIWGFDPVDGLALLARTGQTIEVAPGDFRTIKSLEFESSASASDGRPTSLNNTGEVLFMANFTDNSSAILISGVPEPSALLCLLPAFVFLRRLRL